VTSSRFPRVTSGYSSIAPGLKCAQRWKGISMTESPDHITCQELVELVTDYFDGALPPRETELFEQHMNFCEGCDWYVDEMRKTVATNGKLKEEDVPDEVLEPLLTAFRDRARG
jgi:anti-sigma factor RsiW